MPVQAVVVPVLDVPNAFTPGRNGKNSIVKVEGFGIGRMSWKIYNRWGQLIYRTQNWKNGWDGTLNGKPQPTSVYIWTLNYTDRDTKLKVQNKGTFVLIR